MTLTTIAERVQALRTQMQAQNIDAFFVPSSDAHQNEYLPVCWNRRPWISGFTGSMGDALIASDNAWLWVDSRYYLQADQEVDSNIYDIQKVGLPEARRLQQIIADDLKGKTIAVDTRLVTLKQSESIEKVITENGGTFKAITTNPIDTIWDDQDPVPSAIALVWEEQYAGKSVSEKLTDLRKSMKEKKCNAHVISMLDAIAWQFNIRGRDIRYNPVVISYAIVNENDATLFVDPDKITNEVADHFQHADVRIQSYEDLEAALKKLSGKVWLDEGSASRWVADCIKESGAELVRAQSPITLAKALKNSTELDGMRAAHVRDGVAVVRFLHWLDSAWQGGELNELSAAAQLLQFREDGEKFVGLSFQTITGFGPHGAIVHYSADEKSSIKIDDSAMYLVDSGGQYYDGTTDITRTVHLGNPTDIEREHFTLVLMGHLDLGSAIFPKGTCGENLDILARRPLWERGLNFGHGTGHGVGCHLNVHEGPHRIAPTFSGVAFQAGMVVSNEPGYYAAGEYGIRVENLIAVCPCPDLGEKEGDFFRFEDLTLVPHARKLIKKELLSSTQKTVLNRYHQKVFSTLKDLVPAETLVWLEAECAAID